MNLTLTEYQFKETVNKEIDSQINALKLKKSILLKFTKAGFVPKYIGKSGDHHIMGVDSYNKLTYEQTIEYLKCWCKVVEFKHYASITFSTAINIAPPIVAYMVQSVEPSLNSYHFKAYGVIGKEKFIFSITIAQDAHKQFYEDFKMGGKFPKTFPFVSGAYHTFNSINEMSLWLHQNIGIKSMMT